MTAHIATPEAPRHRHPIIYDFDDDYEDGDDLDQPWPEDHDPGPTEGDELFDVLVDEGAMTYDEIVARMGWGPASEAVEELVCADMVWRDGEGRYHGRV